jgi:hypothetical protein
MAYDRSDHLAVVRDRQHEKAREIMPLVRLVAGASAAMTAVTTDDNWNRYLSFLQGISDSFTKALESARTKLGSGSLTAEALQKLNCDAMVAKATIDAFRLAIDLPRAIMEGKGEADRLVKEFERAEEKKNENAA